MTRATSILAAVPLAVLALGSASAGAQQPVREHAVVLMGDALVTPDPRHVPPLDRGIGLELRYNGFTDGKPLGYEVHLGYEPLKPKNAGDPKGNRSSLGVQGVYRFPGLLGIVPYALAGVGVAYNDKLPGADPYGALVNGGVGVMSGPLLQLLGRPLRVRLEGQYRYEDYNDLHTSNTAVDRANYHDVHAFLGVQWTLTRPPEPPHDVEVVPPAPAPEPPPAPVVEPVVPDTSGAAVAEPPAPEPVTLETAHAGDTVVLHGVNFETNSSRLTANARTILDDVVKQLQARPELKLEIAGHTDGQGSAPYNRKLSQRRAQSVLDYLVSGGVDAARLSAVGYGLTQPIDTNDTDEGRERNRRVELRVQGG